MKSSYRINWTNHALNELKEVFDYLEVNWSEKELRKLSVEIEKALELISMNPSLFPKTSKKKGVRRVVITKHNTLYYRENNRTIEVLSFFRIVKNLVNWNCSCFTKKTTILIKKMIVNLYS